MARPVDPVARVGIENGDYHVNLIKAKSRQYYSAANFKYPSGPKQMHSEFQHGNSEGKKKHGSYSIRIDFTRNEPHGHRQRVDNLKYFGCAGQLKRQEDVFDNGIGISIDGNARMNDDVKDFCGKLLLKEKRNDEKAFVDCGRNLEGDEIGRNQKVVSPRKDVTEDSQGLRGRVTAGNYLSGRNVCEKPSLDKQTEGNTSGKRVTVNGFVKTSTDRVYLSGNKQEDEVFHRSESIDQNRPKLKPTNIKIVSKSYDGSRKAGISEGKVNNDGKGKARVVIRSFDESSANTQGEVTVPKLDLGSNSEGEKFSTNNRYSRTSDSTNLRRIKLSSSGSIENKSCPEFGKMNRDPIASGDKPMKRNEGKGNFNDRIVKVQRHSVDVLHARQGSDPTSLQSARKLSSVSQDLMRSKEELISRSKECGRMLEQYKQRGQELREQIAERRSEAPQKPPAKKPPTRDFITDANSGRNSCDDEVERSYSQRKPYMEKLGDTRDDVGHQSPKYGKRKGSYIDSWLQSQQSRISTLVSAIKEEDADNDTKMSDNSRERTNSAPQNMSFVSSPARNDGLNEDLEIQPSHRRSRSGEEIMGIPKNSNYPRYPEVKRQTPRDSPRNRSRAESPKHSDGYSPDDMRQRSLSIQKESYSKLSRAGSIGKQSNRSSRSISPTGAGNGNGNFRPISVSSPRSQSETASPRLQHSFDSPRSVSLGNSPRLRKETTFDSDIVTQVVTENDTMTMSPRPVVSRRSSSGSDYFPKYGSLPKSGSPRKTSAPNNYFFGEQDNQRFGSLPRSPPVTSVSSSFDQGDLRFNSLPRRSSNQFSPTSSSPTQSQFSPTNSLTRRKEPSDERVAKQQAPSQQLQMQAEADTDLSFRSGAEDKFDWPEPPDFDNITVDISDQNQSWPNTNGSSPPFTNNRGHQDGSKSFPVAVVKPLQHEKSRSWDANDPGDEGKNGFKAKLQTLKGDLGPSIKDENAEIHEIENQTVNCYNVRISQDIAADARGKPRYSPTNTSQEFREKAVDVGPSCEQTSDLSDADLAPNISSLIIQDFQWYKPMGQSSKVNSLDRDDVTRASLQEAPRDSMQERLGRFKRGSKLLSSKYQSFSKSLENLSKVGKDFIKSKKKSGDGKEEKQAEKGDGKKSAKSKSQRKSVVLGDVQLNEEFAMKMERRGRVSLDSEGNEADMRKRQEASDTFQSCGQSRPAYSEVRQQTKTSSSSLNRSLNSSTNSSLNEETAGVDRRRISESKRTGYEGDVIKLHEGPGNMRQPFLRGGRVETEFGVRDSIRRREVKSEYFESVEESKFSSARPKSEYFEPREEDSVPDVNSGFVDYNEAEDEEEKEMVKIVRKISGLRSSQVKIKKDPPSRRSDTYASKKIEASKNVPETRDGHDKSNNVRSYSHEGEWNMVNNNIEAASDSSFETPKEHQQQQQQPGESNIDEPVARKQASNPDPMKRISTSLSRVMTDLRELREQDLTLATQLITLGKSIKHFKQQKKEMDDFYAQLDDGESTDESDTSDEEETASYTTSRMTTDF